MRTTRLGDARVVVTGASRGIGQVLARRFAAAGAELALVARSRGPIEALAAELGGRAYAVDLCDRRSREEAFDAIEADGPIDVLVNNAGIDASGSFVDSEPAVIDELLELNLHAPIQLCRQVLPGMLARGRGHIVNVSSLAGTNAIPGITAYSASKAGLSHFTASLRAELKGSPVRTTLVQIGPVRTEMIDHLRSYGPSARALRRLERLRLSVDLTAEQVADAVVGAVEDGKRHVRLPRRAASYPLAVEVPRRLSEILLAGVDARDTTGTSTHRSQRSTA